MFPTTHYRPLTEGEIQLTQSVYRDSIDCTRVRIHHGKFIPLLQFNHVAMTPFGTAHFPTPLYETDFSRATPARQHLFIHEMAHIWQHQLGLPVWWHGLCLALKGGYRHNACYAYAQHATHCPHLNQLNIEQQADLIADWFVFGHTCALPHIAQLLQPFIDNPADPTLLPQHSHLPRHSN